MKYVLISSGGEGLYKEKGSKFLSFAYPLTHEGHAKELIAEIKSLYFDANHYCYAYLYGLDTPSLGIHDDGEPKHSAGDPILGQIKSFNVSNALVVVVRYFGGTKLGVGGLSNAYRQAAAAALTQAVLMPYIEKKRFKVFYDYDQTKLLLSLFRDYEPEIIEKEYLQKCWMVVDVKKEQATAFKDRLHRNEFQLTEDVK
jgi:uncharacterized YigZ family protein|tara:strand:- start:208 stop:804 length:597 start_codon:yes stop_codon:yes gene_type:complete